jgi:hypothetical protein
VWPWPYIEAYDASLAATGAVLQAIRVDAGAGAGAGLRTHAADIDHARELVSTAATARRSMSIPSDATLSELIYLHEDVLESNTEVLDRLDEFLDDGELERLDRAVAQFGFSTPTATEADAIAARYDPDDDSGTPWEGWPQIDPNPDVVERPIVIAYVDFLGDDVCFWRGDPAQFAERVADDQGIDVGLALEAIRQTMQLCD